jgi:hypothetical protein
MHKFLSQLPRQLNKSNIEQVTADYEALLREVPTQIKTDNALSLMKKLKREHLETGPYPGVTLFEAANRIMTDLTILYGVKNAA